MTDRGSTSGAVSTPEGAAQPERPESSRVARRAGLVALGTLVSRVLGMAREAVVAASFSVAQTDAFFIAFTIPNTLRMLLGEGAVANAFVPVYSDVRARRGEQAANVFLSRFVGAFGLLLIITCLLGMLLAPGLATLYAAGFRDEPERFALVISLTRWLFPFLGLVGLAALATGALNVHGRFGIPALAPALLNVAMIAAPFSLLGLAYALGLPGISALALGALIGGSLQLSVQLPSLARVGALVRPRLDLRDREVRRALSLMLPLALGLGVYQLNMLLSRLFASYMPEGSQSYLNYGQRVIEVPQGMFALALASAALPTLSRLRSEGKRDELLSLFRYSLRLTLFIAVPASVLIFALAEPIAAVLFGRGVFGAKHVMETGRSLAVQALGVWAVAGVRAVIPMFSAHEDTKTPVKASGFNLLIFLVLSASLMRTLDHVAIAVANSAASAVQLLVLLWSLRQKLGPLGLHAVAKNLAKVLAASVVMGLVAAYGASLVRWNEAAESSRLLAFSALCVASGTAFVLVAKLLGTQELAELIDAVRRRAKRGT